MRGWEFPSTCGVERFSSGITYGERTTEELKETLGAFTKGSGPGGEAGALPDWPWRGKGQGAVWERGPGQSLVQTRSLLSGFDKGLEFPKPTNNELYATFHSSIHQLCASHPFYFPLAARKLIVYLDA